jgi:hypothetical protein
VNRTESKQQEAATQAAEGGKQYFLLLLIFAYKTQHCVVFTVVGHSTKHQKQGKRLRKAMGIINHKKSLRLTATRL